MGLPTVNTDAIASNLESLNVSFSPETNSSPFLLIYEIWVSLTFSAYTAIAPDVAPWICSPTDKSEVFPLGPVMDAKVSFGADGSEVSADS